MNNPSTRINNPRPRGSSRRLGGLGLQLIAVPVMMGCVALAAADGPSTGSSTTLRVGFFSPTDSLTKNAMGSSWLSFGLDYEAAASSSPNHPRMFAFSDFTFKSASASDGSGDSASLNLASVGVGIGFRQYFGQDNPVQPYVGAALAAYENSASGTISSGGDFAAGSDSSTNFGFKLEAGVRFQRLVLELSYNKAGDVGGINLDGYRLELGYRF